MWVAATSEVEGHIRRDRAVANSCDIPAISLVSRSAAQASAGLRSGGQLRQDTVRPQTAAYARTQYGVHTRRYSIPALPSNAQDLRAQWGAQFQNKEKEKKKSKSLWARGYVSGPAAGLARFAEEALHSPAMLSGFLEESVNDEDEGDVPYFCRRSTGGSRWVKAAPRPEPCDGWVGGVHSAGRST